MYLKVFKNVLNVKNRLRTCFKGQATVELMFSIMMFVSMLGTLIMVSLYLYMSNTLLTAAKEGARVASINQDLAATQGSTTYNDGVSAVQSWVQSFMQTSSGIVLPTSDVSVSGPTGTVGSRTVQVTVSYQFQDPLAIRTFMSELGGHGTSSGLDTYTLTNSATMRYEE